MLTTAEVMPKTQLDVLLDGVEEEYKTIYTTAYNEAENELMGDGELPDSKFGMKYCQQAAEKAVVEAKIASKPVERARPTGVELLVRKALRLKQHASQKGEEVVFNQFRLAFLVAYVRLQSENDLNKGLIDENNTDWIGVESKDGVYFMDMTIEGLASQIVDKAKLEGKDVKDVLLQAALKNARVTKEKVTTSTATTSNESTTAF